MSIFDQYEEGLGNEVDRQVEIDYEHLSDASDEGHVEEQTERPFSRLHLAIIVVVGLALGLRLFQLQIVQGRQNASLARQHSIRQIIQPASRGTILDARGEWLARNTSSSQVQVQPSDLPRLKSDRQLIYDGLAQAMHWSSDEKTKWVTSIEDPKILYTIDPVVVAQNVPHDEALVLLQQLSSVQAVSVVPEAVRQYNNPTNGLSHILGYVGQTSPEDIAATNLHRGDTIGKAGIESTYDSDLRGKDGIEQDLVDSKGKVLQILQDKSQSAVPGGNLVLHLDLKLQNIMATELKNGLDKAGISSGAAIAMNPQNGAILGMVSLPAYDNNAFSNGIDAKVYQGLVDDPNKPLFNRATQGTFATGSTIKPVIASIGLQDGVINENTTIDTPAEIVVGDSHFPNWQHFFIPHVDVKTAIALSNDVFFYSVGGGWDKIKGLGIDKLSQGLGLFGFGQKTGIDLPSESVGTVPNPDWKQAHKNEGWRLGDTYHLSIGQGDFLATPLQLINATSAIANGGTLYQPQLVDRLTDQNGNTTKTIAPVVQRKDFIDKNNIETVRAGMRQAVTNGSARLLQDLPVPAAGKTGTAQFGTNNEFLHSWFDAFAPYDNPQIAIVVLAEKGSQQNEGNTTAEPIANAILQQYFSPDFNK